MTDIKLMPISADAGFAASAHGYVPTDTPSDAGATRTSSFQDEIHTQLNASEQHIRSSQRSFNSLGDNMTKSMGQFFDKFGSLNANGNFQSSEVRAGSGKADYTSAPHNGQNASGKISPAVKDTLDQIKNISDYSSYLSVTVSMVQTAIGSLKKLQQSG
jgi:hypothetical protein